MIKENSYNIIYDYKNKLFLHNNSKLSLYLSGSFSNIKKQKKNFICQRDIIGTKKLFYGLKNKKIIFSNNYLNLINKCKISSIKSVPKGAITKISNNGKIIYSRKIISDESSSITNIKKNLIMFLERVKKLEKKNTCIICLSGGLDSSLIAYYLKKRFKKVISVTAYCKDNFDALQKDLNAAKIISKKLKIKNISVPIKLIDVKQNLLKILYSCQDWRDYNVHCATINFFIAKYLKNNGLNKYPVFTGDFMNEFTADYESEIINNKEYYKISKINKKLKQRFLISSLDSSSRENGVFNFFKIPLYQPFSVLVNFYKKIPTKQFLKKNFKYNFNKKLISKSIFKQVLTKKTRAQTGDSSGGIINYFNKLNLSQKEIEKIFDNHFKTNKNWRNKFINLGSFRV